MRRRNLLINSGGGGSAEGHDFVEIGGVKWATTNIGAEKETDYGLYFAWGDTAGYTSGQCGTSGTTYAKPFYYADYKFNGGRTTWAASGMTKYNSSYGKTVLELYDDAATLYWGGDWKMPTKEDFAALSAATKFIDATSGAEITGTDKRTTLSGVTGILLEDKTDSSKRLFFPAAGLCFNGSFSGGGSSGYYWSSSLSTSDVNGAYSMGFNSSSVYWQDYRRRYHGRSVRPVLGL